MIGIWTAYRELAALGWLDGAAPRLAVARSEGSRQSSRPATRAGRPTSPGRNRSIVRGVAIPDPDTALEMARTGGSEIYDTSAVALAGAMRRADAGAYDADETLVVINTGAGCKTAGRLGARARDHARDPGAQADDS